MTHPLEERIMLSYAELSGQQKRAADFVMKNPFEVATRSMRSVAALSGLSPATYTRLARAIGLEDYDALKSLCVSSINQNPELSFHERAERLQKSGRGTGGHFFFKQASAGIRNIETLSQQLDPARLNAIIRKLAHARQIGVMGALASAGFAHYFSYLGGWCAANWRYLGEDVINSAAGLSDFSSEDVLFVITKWPNSTRTLSSLEYAREHEIGIILIADNHKCPAIPLADEFIVVPTDSPQFFSSYVATTLVLETIIGMLVMQGGDASQKRIASIEETNRQIGEYWSG